MPRRYIGIFYAVLGMGAIATALAAEHIGGMVPCKLCLMQRVPYVVVAVLGVALFARRENLRHFVLLLFAVALTFVVGGAIGLYQTGGEQQWWQLSQGCSADALTEALKNGGDFAAALKAQEAVPCDKVSFSVMGLSFASINVIFSFIMAVITGFVALRIGKCTVK